MELPVVLKVPLEKELLGLRAHTRRGQLGPGSGEGEACLSTPPGPRSHALPCPTGLTGLPPRWPPPGCSPSTPGVAGLPVPAVPFARCLEDSLPPSLRLHSMAVSLEHPSAERPRESAPVPCRALSSPGHGPPSAVSYLYLFVYSPPFPEESQLQGARVASVWDVRGPRSCGDT